jgi:NTE family protein
MLSALQERGIEPDLLVGTSVGAVNAAYLGGPGTTTERLRSLTRLWQAMRRQDVFAIDPRRWFAAARGAAPSLFSGRGLQRLLADHLGYESLDDARIPVQVTATDFVTGRGVVITHGSAITAVRASAAVLGILPPLSVSPADFSQTSPLIARAHESTSRWLQTAPERDDASALRFHSHRSGVAESAPAAASARQA